LYSEGEVGLMSSKIDPIQRLQNFVQVRREQNATIVQEIQSLGGDVEPTMARLEHFIQMLEDEGIITPEQRWEEQKAWEIGFRDQLVVVRNRIREAREAQLKVERQQHAIAVKKTEAGKKLWTPGM
jgi:hypothetical protein